jgi:uncharacterized repeat protein (TIGR03806 family)
MKKLKRISPFPIALAMFLYIQACKSGKVEPSDLNPKLSDYAIYQGNATDLKPNSDYKLYELSSQLFSDYAEKQRLIKLPVGKKLNAVNDGLVDFPEGTIIVKTFYYFNDKRDKAKGKKLMETRLLVKTNSEWKVGTYMWNEEQTEANLITSGIKKTVNWIDEKGIGNVIAYHIPNNTECRTCHNSNSVTMPIGPKVRNLNFDVMRNNLSQNQLNYLSKEGVLNNVNPKAYSTLPNYKDTTLTLEKRARAYFEINCAHCHSDKGFASNRDLRFAYEHSLQETKILDVKSRIISRTQNGQMPKVGITVTDKDGIALIKKYIESL